jgi:hypothetical protein
MTFTNKQQQNHKKKNQSKYGSFEKITTNKYKFYKESVKI